MAKPRKQVSLLVKRRLDRGIHVNELAKKAGIAPVTVGRIERGEAVTRPIMRKYLCAFNIDLAEPSTWPTGLNIIDKGVMVLISSDIN